ncbi:MAG TPA: N-acetylmuramoyl-L-alanine amidase [Firmicutes bacterium]|jgi:N-acetylmuramoyl-L-alanine amidase|nr:N-acetylmuramoyl-L-alanine amidase [Bacillota bacterium]
MLKIIVDPGHGGKDAGGGSNSLFKEKEWNLQASLYMKKLFESYDLSADLTRDIDMYVGPQKRARIVRESGALVCISNHVNALNGHQSGFEIYHSIFAQRDFAECIKCELNQTDMPPNGTPIRARRGSGKPARDYYFMHRDTGAVQTLIVEYGYGDHPADRERLAHDWQPYVEAVVRGTIKYLKKAG